VPDVVAALGAQIGGSGMFKVWEMSHQPRVWIKATPANQVSVIKLDLKTKKE
jgi:hypothetical protein